MKHNLYRRVAALLCTLVLTLSLAPAARAAGTPAESNNWLEYKFTDFSYCINSYLYANPSGGLTRVEYISASNTIVAEDYSSSFQFQSSRTIPIELESFVGFFAGSQYNYLFFANKNRDNNDSVEVFRAVKYDKSWNRLGQASVKDRLVTQFDMDTIVANLIQDKTTYIDVADRKSYLDTVTDYDGSWPYSAQFGVPICLYTGVMTGLPDGAFHGDQTVTRAQTCAVINRVLEYIAPYMG